MFSLTTGLAGRESVGDIHFFLKILLKKTYIMSYNIFDFIWNTSKSKNLFLVLVFVAYAVNTFKSRCKSLALMLFEVNFRYCRSWHIMRTS